MAYTKPVRSHTTIETFARVERDEILGASQALLAAPDIEIRQQEKIFTIESAGLEWDIGIVVYEPTDASRTPIGADGKKVGVFLLHGGAGDYKSMERQALLLASKYGYRVVSATYPGRLFLDDPSRDWPGDTINPDGSVRTPIWKQGEHITPDQYEVRTDETMRERYGRRTFARALPGSRFRDRLAAAPIALEEACRQAMVSEFPNGEYSIYLHGHSTGGPLQFMMSQRVPNVSGVLAIENSAFGYINEQKHAWSGALGKTKGQSKLAKGGRARTDPFDELYIRTWRDTARYRGAEALGREGPDALLRLPWLMEDVLDDWEIARLRPQFKSEYLVTWNIIGSLSDAALHTAARLGLSEEATDAMAAHFMTLTRELTGPDVKPVPNVLFGISGNSRDHSPEVYQDVILPMFAAMEPAPLATLTHFQAGQHYYISEEPDLPYGIAPAVFASWDDAIKGGYFL